MIASRPTPPKKTNAEILVRTYLVATHSEIEKFIRVIQTQANMGIPLMHYVDAIAMLNGINNSLQITIDALE